MRTQHTSQLKLSPLPLQPSRGGRDEPKGEIRSRRHCPNSAMEKTLRKTVATGIAKVLKRLHYPLDGILDCVRRYVSCSLSPRGLEEMFRKHKGTVGKSWWGGRDLPRDQGRVEVSLTRRGRGWLNLRLPAARPSRQACSAPLLRESSRAERRAADGQHAMRAAPI